MSADIKNQSNHIDESHSHPEPMTYFKVAMALVVLTALEILVFYFDWLGYGIIPVLAFLSIGKFAIVYFRKFICIPNFIKKISISFNSIF